MSESKLELINVSKTFFPGTVNERKTLRNICLSLESGDFITIIGSNGAGKTSLFNAICGSFMIDSGSILLDGREIKNMPDYKRALSIGRLFQDPMKGTAPHLTIEENLSLAYGNKGGKHFFAVNRKNRAKFRELLAELELGLEDRMTTKIGLLSGGQRQAVSLLMATISEPKLLLLDEHTAALDPATAKKVLAITVSIVEKTRTPTLMITHDIRAALEVGTRTIMMDEGRIILDIKGEERKNMTIEKLLQLYSKESKKQLFNDRMLFETEKQAENNTWYCKATDAKIDKGLCWEYCFSGRGGPTDTAEKLNEWIKKSNKYNTLDDFHKVCEKCPHYQCNI